MHFRDPLYNKMALLRPLYQKMAFSRTSYITKWHFGDPPRQQNGIFETPYKKCIFGTPLYNKFSRFDPLYKNGKNLTPLYKMPKMWPPSYTKNLPPYTIFFTPIQKNYPYQKIYPYTKQFTPYTKRINPYTKKLHFRDPYLPYTKNGIFETPLYNKMAFSRPPF